MSLITWYPLNGNLDDYSSECNNITSSGGISVNNNGKIGKCYHFNNGYAITKNTLCGTNIFSICFWMKPNSPGAWTNIFSTNSSSYFRLEVTDNKSIYRIYGDGPIGSNVVVLDGIQDNKWVHVSIVSNGTKWYTYVNGILNKSGNCTSYLIKGDNLYIGRRGSNDNSWNGYLNDIRIYNHALSVKEVKEIAKANILHYKFNDAMEEPTINLRNTVNFTTAEKGTDYFVKKETDAWYNGATLPDTNVQAGKSYTWSMDILCDRAFTLNFDPNCIASNYTGNDAAMESSKSSTSSYDTPGEWKRIYLTVKVKSDAVSPYLCHSFCPSAPSGGSLKVYVRRPSLEEKDHNTPYTSGTRNIGITDSSGFRNHATTDLIVSPSWQKDSAIGDGSFKFDGSIKMSNGNYQHISSINSIRIPEEGTISFYIKHSGTENTDNKYAVGFSNFCSMNNNNIMGLIYYYDTSNYTTKTVTKQLRDGNWHLYTITWSTILNNAKFYADGLLVGTVTPGTMSHVGTERKFLVGNAWGTNYGGHSGGLDDVRLYATQLSDNDVLELYRTKGSLSKNGRVFVNEINENSRSLVNINDISSWGLTNVTLSSSVDSNKGVIKFTNSAATAGQFRIAFTLERISAHTNKPITFSFNYRIIKGNNFSMTDWCDGTITKNDSFNTMRAQGTRSSYDSTYRFMDFNIGANTEVEIWNIRLETKTLSEYKTSITKKGILDTQEIMELDCSSMKIKNELGANWVRLFYHNNKAGTVLFGNKEEFLKCRNNDKISDLWALELFRGKDGKFEFLLQYQSGGNSYNRWKQLSNFTREPIQGYEPVQVSWTSNYWGGLEYNGGSSTWADGSVNHSNWFYAIGSRSAYSGGIPSWSSAETGWVELWVRCEDPEVMKMLKNGNCRATEFIEI